MERTLGPAAIAQMNNKMAMPYDLTFLINPATESLYARQLKLALSNWTSTQPAIVMLAATDDFATGTAWPLAMHFPDGTKARDYNLPMKDHPTENQWSYITTTVGNDKRQWTHHITIKAKSAGVPDTNVSAKKWGFRVFRRR